MCAWQAVLMMKPDEKLKVVTEHGRIDFQGGVAQTVPYKVALWLQNHNKQMGNGVPIFYIHEIPDHMVQVQEAKPNLRHLDLTNRTPEPEITRTHKKKKKKKRKTESNLHVPSAIEWLVIQNGLGFILGRGKNGTRI